MFCNIYTPKKYSLLTIFFVIVLSLTENLAKEDNHRQTYVVRYKNGETTIPVTVVLDYKKQTEHVINMNPRTPAKSITFYDFKHKSIAYKDLTHQECFLGRLSSQESLQKEDEMLKDLQSPVEAKPLVLTLDSKRPGLTPTEVRNMAGQKIAVFCRRMNTWLLQPQKHHRRNRRNVDRYIEGTYIPHGHKNADYSNYRHETYSHKHNGNALHKLSHENETLLTHRKPKTFTERKQFWARKRENFDARFDYERVPVSSRQDANSKLEFSSNKKRRGSSKTKRTTLSHYVDDSLVQPLPLQQYYNESVETEDINYLDPFYNSQLGNDKRKFVPTVEESLNFSYQENEQPSRLDVSEFKNHIPISSESSNDFESTTSHSASGVSNFGTKSNTTHTQKNKSTVSKLEKRNKHKIPVKTLEYYDALHNSTYKNNYIFDNKEQNNNHDINEIFKTDIPEDTSSINLIELYSLSPVNHGNRNSNQDAEISSNFVGQYKPKLEREEGKRIRNSIPKQLNHENNQNNSVSLANSLKPHNTEKQLSHKDKDRSDIPSEEFMLLNENEFNITKIDTPSLPQVVTNRNVTEEFPNPDERAHNVLQLFTPDEIVIDIGTLPTEDDFNSVAGFHRKPTPPHIVPQRSRKNRTRLYNGHYGVTSGPSYRRVPRPHSDKTNIHKQGNIVRSTGHPVQHVYYSNRNIIPTQTRAENNLPMFLPPGVSFYPRHPQAPYAELASHSAKQRMFNTVHPVLHRRPQPGLPRYHHQRHHRKRNRIFRGPQGASSSDNCCEGRRSCCMSSQRRNKYSSTCCSSTRNLSNDTRRRSVVPSVNPSRTAESFTEYNRKPVENDMMNRCEKEKMCRVVYQSTKPVLVCRDANVKGC